MRVGERVEWALHSCLLLAGLPPGAGLAAQALAEFHGVPKAYLGKALQALAAAGIVQGSPGPRGGYRLSRPPSQITFLDVVEAVEGRGPSFRCAEIRRNNPSLPRGARFTPMCGIARVMLGADAAWRKVLAETTLEDTLRTLPSVVPPGVARRSEAWLRERVRGA